MVTVPAVTESSFRGAVHQRRLAGAGRPRRMAVNSPGIEIERHVIERGHGGAVAVVLGQGAPLARPAGRRTALGVVRAGAGCSVCWWSFGRNPSLSTTRSSRSPDPTPVPCQALRLTTTWVSRGHMEPPAPPRLGFRP